MISNESIPVLKNFIGNKHVSSLANTLIDSYNPSTGDVIFLVVFFDPLVTQCPP